MPDFYDMHVALCREKRTPKRTPLRDAASPTATLPLLTLALPSAYLRRRAWRACEGNPKLETEFTLFTEDTILPPIGTYSFHFPYL